MWVKFIPSKKSLLKTRLLWVPKEKNNKGSLQKEKILNRNPSCWFVCTVKLQLPTQSEVRLESWCDPALRVRALGTVIRVT